MTAPLSDVVPGNPVLCAGCGSPVSVGEQHSHTGCRYTCEGPGEHGVVTCVVCRVILHPARDPAVTTLGPRCAQHWHSPAH